MSAGESDIALRPARAEDETFLARVYASTREEELSVVPWPLKQKDAFLRQQFAAQSAHYATHYGDVATFDVVVVDGVDAGRLIVARGERELRIVDIALLPEFRSRGIGARLLAPLIAEAEAAGVPVGIHVEQTNRALRFYERLGFVRVGDQGVYLKLERPPEAGTDGLPGAGTVGPPRAAVADGPPRASADPPARGDQPNTAS